MWKILKLLISTLGVLWLVGVYLYCIWYTARGNDNNKIVVLTVVIVGGGALIYFCTWGIELDLQIQHFRQHYFKKQGVTSTYQIGKRKQSADMQETGETMRVFSRKSRVFTLSFALIIGLVTLFPPFYWGEEIISNKVQALNAMSEEARDIVQFDLNTHLNTLQRELPIKQHSYLFGNNKEWFDIPLPPERKAAPLHYKLDRRIIVSELLLYYVLAFVVSVVLQLLVSIRKNI